LILRKFTEDLANIGEIIFVVASVADSWPWVAYYYHRGVVLGVKQGYQSGSVAQMEKRDVAKSGGFIVSGTVWVYTGMGPQWAGMGREMMPQTAFAAGWQLAVAALYEHGVDLRDLMQQPLAQIDMSRNDLAKPANFALQVALTYQLRQHGLQADAIVGHSSGEMAAAWAAGALALGDAARVVAVMSRLQQTVAGGGMLGVGISGEALAAHMHGIDGVLEIAAYNAPDSVTVAGDMAAIEQLSRRLRAQRIVSKKVAVEVAYHSSHMNPIREPLLAQLTGLQPQLPVIALFSSATGEQVGEAVHDAQYWWHNARDAVQFARAVSNIAAQGHNTFVQIGPHPALSTALKAGVSEPMLALSLLERNHTEAATFARALDALRLGGVEFEA
jgi:acyl transferase domain-containing protein